MYAKMICMIFPPSTENEISTKFKNIFRKNYFTPTDVRREREVIQQFCLK